MKLHKKRAVLQGKRSLPVRGAWIEIVLWLHCAITTPCRSPCGERGLK